MDYSGRFVLRLPSSLHGQLAREAERRGLSMNRLCGDLLQNALEKGGETEGRRFAALSPLVTTLKKHFKGDLLGVLVFGSQVTGRSSDSSDIDLLIVLSDRCPLTRALYRWWDDHVSLPSGPVVNPQFVHLPAETERAGGLWLEVASASKILWEDGGRVSKAIHALRNLIAQDRFRRCWSNGLPYWVKISEERVSP